MDIIVVDTDTGATGDVDAPAGGRRVVRTAGTNLRILDSHIGRIEDLDTIATCRSNLKAGDDTAGLAIDDDGARGRERSSMDSDRKERHSHYLREEYACREYGERIVSCGSQRTLPSFLRAHPESSLHLD